MVLPCVGAVVNAEDRLVIEVEDGLDDVCAVEDMVLF